jgi:hypothetical protein
MCASSAVTDYYRDKWFPEYVPYNPDPVFPAPVTIQPFTAEMLGGKWISLAEWEEYQALKKRMEEYDAKTNQPDCIKPEVEQMEEVVIRVLKERGVIPADFS